MADLVRQRRRVAKVLQNTSATRIRVQLDCGHVRAIAKSRTAVRCARCPRIERSTLPTLRAKLTAQQIAEIKQRRVGGESISALAMRFGVSRPTIIYHTKGLVRPQSDAEKAYREFKVRPSRINDMLDQHTLRVALEAAAT